MIKECLITVGATAKFTELISAGLSQDCLQTLADNGFTHLNVQYGDSEELFNSLRTATTTGEKPISIKITGFGFDKDGLGKQIAQCQRNPGTSEQGLVICHAGAGTILDVMRLDVSLIVVPNHTLLDNHQEELADELERQGYVTKGTTRNLAKSIEVACKRAAKAWGGHENKFSAVVDDVAGYEMGYEEEVRARLD